jgi:hypothetical protein
MQMPVEPGTNVVEPDPKRPYTAYASGLLTGAGVFVAAWVSDEDPFTGKEVATAVVAAVAAMVPSFGIVFAIANPLRRRRSS